MTTETAATTAATLPPPAPSHQKRQAATRVQQPPSDEDLITAVLDYLCQRLPDAAAHRADWEAALRADFGGRRHYVPTKPAATRDQLAQQILALYNGRNASQIARRLRIGRATVYRVLKQPRGMGVG